MHPKIVLVEDTADIREVMEYHLQKMGAVVVSFEHGTEALKWIESHDESDVDLFLLDCMLPGISGIDLCRFIRKFKRYAENPIIMVTALSAPESIVEGLEAGADDYITKPFEQRIFLARIKRQVNRWRRLRDLMDSNEEPNLVNIIEVGDFKLNAEAFQLILANNECPLTRSEFLLMHLLMKNVGRVLGREQLVGMIQGDDVHVTKRTIDTHIFGLRKKLGEYARFIETIRGVGYRFSVDEDEER
jgi:two-component system, OmpR family, phosphate regulon response regulator PhoB